ncbi:DNA gyrase inhibitor YacG [bacterium HR36]|nr:DNA gyrase inhibitor YacG [bacterium HR36]
MMQLRCPICGKEICIEKLEDLPTFPFCSRRCRIIDTGRWLGGEYRIPVEQEDLDALEKSDAAEDSRSPKQD